MKCYSFNGMSTPHALFLSVCLSILLALAGLCATLGFSGGLSLIRFLVLVLVPVPLRCNACGQSDSSRLYHVYALGVFLTLSDGETENMGDHFRMLCEIFYVLLSNDVSLCF